MILELALAAFDVVVPIEGRADGASSLLVSQRASKDDHPDAEELALLKAAGVEDQAGTTLFVASTDTPDRAMDVVKQDWRLRSFNSNPVILDNHSHLRVVGRGLSAKVPRVGDDMGKLMIRVLWDQESPDPTVRNVGHQHLNGFRSAGSVGFRHGKKTRRDKLGADHPHFQEPVEVEGWWGKELVAGFLFEQNELLEFSSATVPMNGEALQRAVKGLVVDAARIVDPTAAARDAIRSVLLELVKDPETRRALFLELAPELKTLMRTDPEIRRIVAAYPNAGPPAPTTGPGLFASVLRRMQGDTP